MAKFRVFFTPQALDDVLQSYEWGVANWGEAAAEKWLRELHRSVYERLAKFPKACQLAPESDELGVEVRQLLFMRYRILFQVEKKEVIVIRVAGPYAAAEDD